MANTHSQQGNQRWQVHILNKAIRDGKYTFSTRQSEMANTHSQQGNQRWQIHMLGNIHPIKIKKIDIFSLLARVFN